AENAALSLMVGELRGALYSFRIRVAFIGHPGERFWDTGEGHMLPDWRDELQESETALALPLPESAKKAAAERALVDAVLA
ncbi:hypothetical protein, partial [Lactococcus petauri]|uniref:hypothetical protein n=1 Tax=Lactococcus petauri TaxID=1940789 RepID=UPI0021F1EA88